MLLISLFTADTALSRFNPSLLTDQMRMEILISDMPEEVRELCQDFDGNYKDACTWFSVQCNNSKDVITLNWTYPAFYGTIQLHALPPQLEILSAARRDKRRKLSGTIDTAVLPNSLRMLSLSHNLFTGSFNFLTLPTSLTELSIGANDLSGAMELTNLPVRLELLVASNNKFTGEINLRALPATLMHINLSSNALSGGVNLTKLPCLNYLDISFNQLSGSVNLGNLPFCLRNLYLQGNAFVGTAHIDRLPHAMEYLCLNDNAFSALVYYGEVPVNIKTLDCSGNPIEGEVPKVQGGNFV